MQQMQMQPAQQASFRYEDFFFFPFSFLFFSYLLLILNLSAAPQNTPLEALLAIKAILALRTQKAISGIASTASIKELSSGNSAMQNELLGDLQSEFSGASFPDGAESLPLDKLAQHITSYATLGKITKARVSKLVSAKMPVGLTLSSLREHLKGKGLGEGSVDTVLLHAITMEPKLRLGSEQEAWAWLEGVLGQAGIVVGQASQGPALYAMQPANSAHVSALSLQFEKLVQNQMNAMSQYLGMAFFCLLFNLIFGCLIPVFQSHS
jgi:fatty acid synthase subunit beta